MSAILVDESSEGTMLDNDQPPGVFGAYLPNPLRKWPLTIAELGRMGHEICGKVRLGEFMSTNSIISLVQTDDHR